MDREVGAVHPREVEQVANQAFEPRGLDRDRLDRFVHVEGAVCDALGVAADRGERCLQLVADREQELLLGGPRPRQLLRHLVEGPGEAGDLVRTLDRHRLGIALLGEAASCIDDTSHRPGNPACEQEGGKRRQRDPCAGGDQQADEEGIERVVAEALRPQQHELEAAFGLARGPGGVEVGRVADPDRPVEALLRPHDPVQIAGEVLGRTIERHTRCHLVLSGEIGLNVL